MEEQDYKCIYMDHESEQILGFCLDSNCDRSPFCIKCLKTHHKNHLENCIEYNEINKLVFELLQEQNQNIVQIKDIKEQIQQIFQRNIKKLRTTHEENFLSSKYHILIRLIDIIKEQMEKHSQFMKDLSKNAQQKIYYYISQRIVLIKIYNNETFRKKQNKMLNAIRILVVAMEELTKKHDENLKYQQLQVKEAEEYFLKGNELNEMKKYEEAVACYDKAIQINPRHYDAYNNKGITLNDLKRHEEAIQCLDKLIQVNSNYYKAYNNKGNYICIFFGYALTQMERFDEAITCYQRAIKINPQYDLAYCNKNQALNKLKSFKAANDFSFQEQFKDIGNQFNLMFLRQKQQQEKTCQYPQPLERILIPFDMKHFLINPIQKGGMIQCTLKRDKSGMCRFYPYYHLYLSNKNLYLMSAKKRACSHTSNFTLSLSQKDFEKGDNLIGKVRSNFLGTEFVLYDAGLNPKKTQDYYKLRQQLGIVQYEKDIRRQNFRKMVVLLPNLEEREQFYVFKPTNSKDGILKEFQNNNRDHIVTYVNKLPQWNSKQKAFVLNFYKRVDKPSVKNFQLIVENKEDDIVLQFGKVGDDLFNLDFQYPIFPLQAFQIALTSLDKKIGCA